MIHFRLHSPEKRPAIIKLVAGALNSGKVAVLPTDTIYGLSCRADNARALKRIYRMKGRANDRPFILLVKDIRMAKKYAAITPRQEAALKRYWDSARPTTVILPAKTGQASSLRGENSSLAVRLPKSPFLIKILELIKTPIVSTSVNLSGRESLSDLDRLEGYFPAANRPDLVIDTGRCRRRRPSKLIDLRAEGKPRVIRK